MVKITLDFNFLTFEGPNVVVTRECNCFIGVVLHIFNQHLFPISKAKIKAQKYTTWSAQELYKEISDVCFKADPLSRADFSQVVSIIHRFLNEEELTRYNDMQTKFEETYFAENNQ